MSETIAGALKAQHARGNKIKETQKGARMFGVNDGKLVTQRYF
jgi:hypothetical protein